jgi:hypothetical protein
VKGILAAIIIFIFGIAAAFGEMATFKDVQKPDGRERGRTERRSALRACGAGPNYEIPVAKFPAFRQCLQERGWGLDHVPRNAAEAARGSRCGRERATLVLRRLLRAGRFRMHGQPEQYIQHLQRFALGSRHRLVSST